MANDAIRLERHATRAEVILNNPGQLNAMDAAFFRRVRDVFREIDADPSLRVVLLWAEGRAFSVGLNWRDPDGLTPADCRSEAARKKHLLATIRDFQDCFTTVRACRVPVIAAIQGLCVGGGLDLVTACDIRLAAADALFSVQETKMAMVADLGTLQRLGRICGRGFTREVALTGSMIPAARALAAGLVNDVLPGKAELLEAARAMASAIGANSPLAVEGVKRVLDYADEHSEADALQFVAQWNTAFFHSADLDEATKAFAEKRPPRFQGC